MKVLRGRLLSLILGLSLVLYVTAEDNAPELNLATDEVIYHINDTLEIECSGVARLRWIVPETWRTTILNSSRVSDRYEAGLHKPYFSKLVIKDLEYFFTGEYTCVYDGGPQLSRAEQENALLATSVYVYVYDENRLLIPFNNRSSNYFGSAVHASSPLTIPCRPTKPDIKVTLTKSQGDDYNPSDVIYDPRRGFYIEFPTRAFNGYFTCTATNGITITSKFIILKFDAKPLEVPVPIIDIKDAKHAVVNGSFRLTCTTVVEMTTVVYLGWTYPEYLEDVETDNMTTTKHKMRSVQNRNRITIHLDVSRATKNHSARYTCFARTLFGKLQTDSVYVYINDYPMDPYVNLTSDVEKKVQVLSGTDLKLVVNIDFHHPANLTSEDISADWRKGIYLLKEDARITRRMDMSKEMLMIKTVGPDDAGNYTLNVRIGGREGPSANWTVALFVRYKPKVKVIAAKRFYDLGTKFTLSCQAEGYPTPKVWWRWKPYGNQQEQDVWKDVDTLDKKVSLPNSAYASTENVLSHDRVSRNITVSANVSGYYRCMSSNRLGETRFEIPFVVSEDPNGMRLYHDADFIEGQVVSLSCRANKRVYSSLTWSRNSSQSRNTPESPLENETGVEISQNETTYSLESNITFRALKMTNTGEYTCTASFRKEADKANMLKMNIVVKGRSPPHFFNETIPGTVPLELSPADKAELSCKHTGGVPAPNITWYKNGEFLDVNKEIGIEEDSRSQSLVITRIMPKDAGLYICKVNNEAGALTRNFSLTVRKAHVSQDNTQWIYVGIFLVLAPVFICVVVFLLVRICKEKRDRKEQQLLEKSLFDIGQLAMLNPNLPLDEQVELLPYHHKWEFPRDRLKLGRVLGQGAFGRVVKAEAIGLDDSETHTTVAVKMLKERADILQRKALVAELKILIHLGSHLNILNLLGAVTKQLAKGELMVIVEYCRYGNLRNYLLRHRRTFKDLLDPNTGRLDISRNACSDGEDYLTPNDQLLGNGFSNPSYQGQKNLPEMKLNYAHLQHTQTSAGEELICSTPTNSTSNPWDSATYCNTSGSNGTMKFRSRLTSDMTLPKKVISTCDLLCFSFQCARGMEYLASKKLIHRDLAARNVLLAEDNIVKICDFGLAKDCYKNDAYVKKNDGPLPIKWMAIESIGEKVFTTKSDVWSFSILLWEFFTLGGNPYPGVELDEDFYRKLKNGYRMECPNYAPENVYELMRNCWHEDPLQRPNFAAITQTIGDFLEAGVKQHYLELNDPYMEMNMNNPPPVDYLTMVQDEEKTGTNYLTMETDPSTAHYDNLTNVRPVDGDGPVPLQPLEVVPMIQMDPVVVSRNKSFRKALTPPRSISEPDEGTESANDNSIDRHLSTEDDDAASVVFELNTSSDNQSLRGIKTGEDYVSMGNVRFERHRKGNESLRSAASSGFHSDLDTPDICSPPPSYNLVMHAEV